MLSKEDWIARRLVADKFQNRRVFICGDAAHLWISAGGYGMNAGIADAANLAWKLAGTLNGWASPDILDAYDAERQPITDQVSRVITDVAHRVIKQRSEISADIELQRIQSVKPRGHASPKKHMISMCNNSVAVGSTSATITKIRRSLFTMTKARPHTRWAPLSLRRFPDVGCLTCGREGHRSLYDALGPHYTLLRLDPTTRVTGIVEAAANEVSRSPLST